MSDVCLNYCYSVWDVSKCWNGLFGDKDLKVKYQAVYTAYDLSIFFEVPR